MILREFLVAHMNNLIYMTMWNEENNCPENDYSVKTGREWINYWYQTRDFLLIQNCEYDWVGYRNCAPEYEDVYLVEVK